MPLYEYLCEACEHRFEQIRRFSDPPLETCPRCGGAVRKLLSSPAIQFKGTGWYVTDYARQSGKESADPAESKTGAKAEGAASKSEKQDGGTGQDAGKSGGSTGSSDSAGTASKAAKPTAAGASS